MMIFESFRTSKDLPTTTQTEIQPLEPTPKKRRPAATAATDDDSDMEYVPPKRRQEPPSPDNSGRVFDSDGSEIEELTEAGLRRVCTLV